jgi:Tripartite tricarboxylate transporter family receptor
VSIVSIPPCKITQRGKEVRQGKLRALAVTTTTRSPALPDIPPLAEFIPGYEASAWYGVSAPRNTPGRARNERKHHSAFRALAEYLCQNFREIVQISSNVAWIVRHNKFGRVIGGLGCRSSSGGRVRKRSAAAGPCDATNHR